MCKVTKINWLLMYQLCHLMFFIRIFNTYKLTECILFVLTVLTTLLPRTKIEITQQPHWHMFTRCLYILFLIGCSAALGISNVFNSMMNGNRWLRSILCATVWLCWQVSWDMFNNFFWPRICLWDIQRYWPFSH